MLSKLPRLHPRSCLIVLLASAFQAFGIYNIHALSGVTEGGVFGAVLLLDHWFGISPSISSFVLNGACFLLGFRALGAGFIGYSFFAASGFSLGYRICECFPPLWPGIAEHPLSAAVLGALFIGIGSGICVRCGAATGGDDALAMSLHRMTGIRIEWVYTVSDYSVLLLSLSYIPLKRIVFSLITVTISTRLVGLIQSLPLKCQTPPEPSKGCAQCRI